ncbi:MAG: lysophospholipid acyltransferase family protein [Leucothrix sp.]
MSGKSHLDSMPKSKVHFRWALLHPRHLGSWLGLGAAFLLSLLPQQIRHRLGDWVGGYLYRYNQKRRHVVHINLRQVFPELSERELQRKVRQHLSWYGKALIDYSVFFFGSKRRLLRQMAILGEAPLAKIKQQEQPVILLLAHSVMLEFAVVALSKDYNSFGSYKASANPVLDWIIARSRCRFADFVVARDEGLRPLIRAIKSQRIMIFLPDEDLGLDNAIFTPFFGRQKATLTTPARLAKLGGAKALVGFVQFDDSLKQYQLHLRELPHSYPEEEAYTDASSLNQTLEALVLQCPDQYMWLMKWYKTTPEGMQKLY